jgi:hypothetical protein
MRLALVVACFTILVLMCVSGCTPEIEYVEVPQPYPVIEYRTIEVELIVHSLLLEVGDEW